MADFEAKFVETFESKKSETELDWEENWRNKCKGKDLLVSIHNKYGITSYKGFVKNLIASNKAEDTEEWNILKSKLQPILSKK
jgi:hypothetical protein